MEKHKRSLATSGKAEFTVQPPRRKALRAKNGCTCLDKLIGEERERHAKNIAFQKALVKRLEASEKRLSYDDWDEDDDDDPNEGKRRKSRKTEEMPPIKLPKYKPVDDECLCYKKIRKEERKRKRFVKRLEKAQAKYEKKNLRAQRKYEKKRIKAYKKCNKLQDAIDKEYTKGNKNIKITQGDETYSVFIHMDPGKCGCNPRERCMAKFKKYFFKYCTCFYILGFLIAYIIFYVVTKL